jgi:hypothetical protein
MKTIQITRVAAGILFFCFSLPAVNAQQQKNKALSQYLFSDFSEGTIKFTNGSYRKAKLNLNTLTGKIVYFQDEKYYDLVNSTAVDTIILYDRKFVFREGLWLEVLVTGKYPLFLKYTGALMSPAKQAGYGTTSQTSSITSISTMQTNTVTYDIKLPDGYTVDLSTTNMVWVDGSLKSFLNEKQLIKIFPDKENQIRQFTKKNKTDFDRPEDLAVLIRYISGL